jgi:hypothetical protein
MNPTRPPAKSLTLIPAQWGAPADSGHRLYRAEAHAHGPVAGAGHRAGLTLGRFTSPSHGRVLRWLRAQALRIADGLDPDPATTPHPTALRPVPAPTGTGDVPAELRQWAHGHGHRSRARRNLGHGLPFLLVSADHTGLYALMAWPLPTPASGTSTSSRPTGT